MSIIEYISEPNTGSVSLGPTSPIHSKPRINKLNNNKIISSESKSNYNKKQCNILIAHGANPAAYFATSLYSYPINFFLYAEKNSLLLWIDYRNEYNPDCYDPKMKSENVWNYYFEEVNPTKAPLNCDLNTSNITTIPINRILSDFHYNTESWSIHAWYYHWHKMRNWNIEYDKYYEAWYHRQRTKGYEIVKKYYKYKVFIIDKVNELWNNEMKHVQNEDKYNILGVHMRGTDIVTGHLRRNVKPEEYIVYINKFIEYYGIEKTKVFIATDDQRMLNYIEQHFIYNKDIYFSQGNVKRSSNETSIMISKDVSKFNIGKEVIVDILMLSKCDWFIHASSAVAEAVFYNNLKLHKHSVHLEYIKDRQTYNWTQ